MDNHTASLRRRFADFLDNMAAANSLSAVDWQRHVVTHYADEFLEEMRRCTVRLMQDRLEYHSNTEASREALRCWAMAIRSSCPEITAEASDNESTFRGGRQLRKQDRLEKPSTVDFATLNAWYRSQCNDEWEHQHGVRLETLDNPGWLLIVDLIHTDLQGRPMDEIVEGCTSSGEPVSPRWIHFTVKDNQFRGACDPTQVERLFWVFDQFRMAKKSC